MDELVSELRRLAAEYRRTAEVVQGSDIAAFGRGVKYMCDLVDALLDEHAEASGGDGDE